MNELVICVNKTKNARVGQVYNVLESAGNLIKIYKDNIARWANSQHFETFKPFKDHTRHPDIKCITCNNTPAALQCQQCRKLLQMAQLSYACHKTDKSRAQEILGQLCYYDRHLAIAGSARNVVSWNVINRIMSS